MMDNTGPLSSMPNKAKWNTIMSINYKIEVDISGLSRANFAVKQNFLDTELALDSVCFHQLTWDFQVHVFLLSSIRSFSRVVFTLPLFLPIESVANRAVCTVLSHLRAFLTVDLSLFIWGIEFFQDVFLAGKAFTQWGKYTMKTIWSDKGSWTPHYPPMYTHSTSCILSASLSGPDMRRQSLG